MPYGVDENLWKRLPASDQASIKQSWQAARTSPPAQTRAATPSHSATGTAAPHPVQPTAAKPAARVSPSPPVPAAEPVTPAYLHALTSAGDISSAQIPSVVAAAQQQGLASPAAIVEARHASQLTAPPQGGREAHAPQAPTLTPRASTNQRLASGSEAPTQPHPSTAPRRGLLQAAATARATRIVPGHVLGRGHGRAFTRAGYTLVRLTKPFEVTRIFGGDASKEGTVFLASGGRGAATSDEATIYLGGALEPGNDASKRATATIPAGTVVLVGLSREIQPGVYRDVVPYLGRRPIVELADVTEAARVKYGATSPLPPNPGFPFGDWH